MNYLSLEKMLQLIIKLGSAYMSKLWV